MTSGFALALVILAVLVGSFWYIIRAEGGFQEIPRLLERVGIPREVLEPVVNFELPPVSIPGLPTPAPDQANKIPAEFQSGDSRFSQGGCFRTENCFTGGCSGEVCSANPDVVSTCEYSESFPNAQGLSCTCLPKGVCGWQ